MLYSIARVSAGLGMRRQDLLPAGEPVLDLLPHVPGDGGSRRICRMGETIEHAQQIAGTIPAGARRPLRPACGRFPGGCTMMVSMLRAGCAYLWCLCRS